MGIRISDFEDFILDTPREQQWDILLLQEFSAATVVPLASDEGHLVFTQAPLQGQRRTAVIINSNIADSVRGDPLSQGQHSGVEV